MKATRVFFAGMMVVLLAWGSAGAQTLEEGQPQPGPEVAPPPSTTPAPTGAVSDQEIKTAPHALSNWITYNRNNCCEALGHTHPIATEMFLRSGISVPLPNTTFGKVLDPGWIIDGGVRCLMFDAPMDNAWTFLASLSNANNSANLKSDTTFIHLSKFLPTKTGIPPSQRFDIETHIRQWNRTFLNLGLGHEWYLWSVADHPGLNWRWGVDGGFRYGTAKVNFTAFQPPSPNTTATTITHGTDVIGGAFAAIHGDLEVPYGCCVLQYGVRGEWAYTWSDTLQRQSDLQELNFLFTAGVRY